MHQVKIVCQQKVERIEMELNDLESQMMNLEIGNHFKTVEEFILDQHKFIKSLHIEDL